MPKSKTKRFIDGLGERLGSLRRDADLPRILVASRARVALPTLADAENHGLATVGTLSKLARLYGVTVDDLVGREPTVKTLLTQVGAGLDATTRPLAELTRHGFIRLEHLHHVVVDWRAKVDEMLLDAKGHTQ